MGPRTNVGTFFTSKWHIVGALLMYRGGPKVTWYVRKVRHAKRGVRARVCPILSSFGKIVPENPCFWRLETGGMMEGTRVGAPNQCWDVLHFKMAHFGDHCDVSWWSYGQTAGA